MTQFTLYENQNKDSKSAYPYFLDIQNNLLDTLNSRLVIPVAHSKSLSESNITNLCPTVTVEDESYILLTQQMTNVPTAALSVPVVSLEHIRDEVVAAIDFLVTGI